MEKNQKKVLVTGSSGFIGKALCLSLMDKYSLIGLDKEMTAGIQNSNFYLSDLSDYENISEIIKVHRPDIIVHCAGIAHQKIGGVSKDEYLKINSIATEYIAKKAAESNVRLHFIFLSSISVYGEGGSSETVKEGQAGNPSSDYAFSKLDAEKRLVSLYDSGKLKKLDVLRLAPVYDTEFSLNLDRRVFAFKKLLYIKFGSGEQKMSAVAIQNLIDFIEYRLKQEHKNLKKGSFCNTFNVCDKKPYKFKEIIRVFKKSDYQPNRLVFKIPLSFVWLAIRIAGLVYTTKRQWFDAAYEKLASDLVFDNKKMLDTGFKPSHTLKTSFL